MKLAGKSPDPARADEVRLRFARAIIWLFEAECAELEFGEEGPVSVEVDQNIRITRSLGFAKHLLHASHGGRPAEIEADIALKRN